MAGRSGRRAGVRLMAIAAGALGLLCACSAGGGARSTATPYASAFDPRSVAIVPTPVTGETDAARTAAGIALQTLADASGGAVHLLSPVVLSGASVVDVLRLSAGAGIDPAAARTRLPALGWRWLVTFNAGELRSGLAREWRVDLLSFSTPSGASQYAADPFLEPAALLRGGRLPAPAGAPADAVFYRATDSVAAPVAQATPGPGERGALLWRRGRIVAAVSETQTPAGLDLMGLASVARILDAALVQVPGSVAP